MIVGTHRAVRFLRELHDLCIRRLRLLLAEPQKWSLGSAGTWVGVTFSSTLGLVWLPKQKSLKLMDMATEAIAGRLTAGQWREMLGFLEHVWSIVRRHRYTIDRLWAPCQQGGELLTQGPAAIVTPTAEQRQLLARAAHVAANTPGASLLACVRDSPYRPSGAVRWVLIGDAAREDDDLDAGLGGHLYHLWCYMPLSQEMFDAFDTPHLEFLQAGMLAITHSRRLAHANWILLAADALGTPTVLSARAKARLMREIHEELISHPEFAAYIRPKLRLETGQRWGVANGIGDAASRAQFDRVERLYAQMGVTPTRVEYSPEAVSFLSAVLLRDAFQARVAAARLWRELTGEPVRRAASHMEQPVVPTDRQIHAAMATVSDGTVHGADEWAAYGYIVIDVRRPGPLGNPWPVLSSQPARWAVESYQRYLLAPRRQVGAVVQARGGELHETFEGDALRRLAERRDCELLRLARLAADGAWLHFVCTCPPGAPCHRVVVTHAVATMSAQLTCARIRAREIDPYRGDNGNPPMPAPPPLWGAPPDSRPPSPPTSPPSSPPRSRPPSPPPSPSHGFQLPHTPPGVGAESEPPHASTPPPPVPAPPPPRARGRPSFALPSTPPAVPAGGQAPRADAAAEQAQKGSPVYDRLLEARRRIAGYWMPRTPPGFEPAGARLRGGDERGEAPRCCPPPFSAAPGVPDADARRRLTLPRTPSPRIMRREAEGSCKKHAEREVLINAAQDRAQGLAEASSRLPGRYAPRPDDPATWIATLRNMLQLQRRAAPRNTLKQENSNLKHWRAWCEHNNTDVIRPSVHLAATYGDDAVAAEQMFWAGALPFIMNRMNEAWVAQPKGRPRPPKPSSAMAVLRGVRRIHVKRLGIESVSLTAAVQVCDGMLREYAERHGPEALIPRRKEPFTRELIEGMLNIPSGTRLSNGAVVNWDTLEWRMVRALLCFMAQSGARKCTVSLPSGVQFNLMHLSLANVVWMIRAWGPEPIAAPTAMHFALLSLGDYALLRMPPDKADQLSLHWGADPIYLPYDPDELICAARELAEAELARACPADQRRLVPLFTDRRGDPLRHFRIDPLLHAMLEQLMPAAETHKYSWHSFRSWLACALLSLKAADGSRLCSEGTIQCMLRWRSPEALRVYARLNPSEYGGLLSSAMTADVSSVRTTNAHTGITYDYDSHAARLQAALPAMYANARAEDDGDEEPLDGLDADSLGPDDL